MKTLALCATLTACLLAFASPRSLPAPPPVVPSESDAEAIQGIWQRVTRSRAHPSPNRLVVIDGHRVTVQQDADQIEYGTFTLDPTATPKAINARFENGPAFGIYELTGDTLRLCISEPGVTAARPTQFQSFGKSVVLAEFRRVGAAMGK